jgi:hypothetical protein
MDYFAFKKAYGLGFNIQGHTIYLTFKEDMPKYLFETRRLRVNVLNFLK